MNDAPIVDDFDSGDPSKGKRNRNWGFSAIKKSVLGSVQNDNGLLGSSGLTKGDVRDKKKSWKDLSLIREALVEMSDVMSDEHKQAKREGSGQKNAYSQKRREWFAKIRHQNKLVDRLTGIEKALKGKGKGFGLMGLLGGLGALGGMLKGILSGKNGPGNVLRDATADIGKKIFKGILLGMMTSKFIGVLTGGIGKMLKRMLGFGDGTGGGGITNKAKTFGSKAKSWLGNGIKAGKSRAMSLILPALGPLGDLLGPNSAKAAGSIMTNLMKSMLPRLLGRLGMAVFGIPGAVAMVAKLVWDHLLPEKWKKYIAYRVSKFYLQAIDKMASLFEWVANTFESLKNKILEKISGVLARIYAVFDFIGNVVTGQGDARQRVKNFFVNLWTTMETSVRAYIGGFLTMFKEAYQSFIKPFYDEKGNFSLIRGIKHYAKSGYNLGVEAVNKADAAVTDTINSAKKAIGELLDSNYNPANWQKNAEVYVQKYEAEKAQAPKDNGTDEAFIESQDAASKVFTKLEKTLTSTNSALRRAASSGFGMVSTAYASNGSPYSPVDSLSTGSAPEGGTSFSNAVSKHESGSAGYNAYNRGRSGDSPQGKYDFTKMTVGQVKQMQAFKQVVAVGKYQMVPDTLKEAQRATGISDNALFDAKTQETMFQNYLIKDKRPQMRDFITGKSNDLTGAQVAMAQEFASVGMPYTGSMTVGKGKNATTYRFQKDGTFYNGIGGNKAHMSSAQSGSLLQQARANYQAAIQGGASPQDAWNQAFGSVNPGAPAMDTTGSAAAPQNQDVLTTWMQTMQNPEQARALYDSSKGGATAVTGTLDSKVAVPTVSPTTGFDGMDKQAVLDAMKNSKVTVNSMGQQTSDAVKRPTSTPKPQAAPAPATVGSNPSDLFSRVNSANVLHENAFPV